MKSILLGATILAGLSAPAWALINDLEINADTSTSGSVKTLSITQDSSNLGNGVGSTAAGGAPLPVAGPWKKISITQTGGATKFSGAMTADSTSTNASLTASYTGGNNTHSLTIGSTTAPIDPVLAINVTNSTGVSTNAITDTLNGTALTYYLTVNGTGNTIHNAVSATGAIVLTQGTVNGAGGGYGIAGDNNQITNTVTDAASFTHNLTVNGSNNIITNNVNTGGGANSITQDIESSSNHITTNLTGGANTAILSVDATSLVTYTQTSSGLGAMASVTLSGVYGAAGAPAFVNVSQTGAGAQATLTVDGGGFTMGKTLAGNSYGVNLVQASTNANLNASVVGNAAGYTVNFAQ